MTTKCLMTAYIDRNRATHERLRRQESAIRTITPWPWRRPKQPAQNDAAPVCNRGRPSVLTLLPTYARDGSSIGKLRKKSVSTTITAGLPIRALWSLPG